MLYRTMPKSEDKISILGFGCMRFPVIKGKIDESKSRNQIERAFEKGINYYDTAFPYHQGASESFLGKTLRETGLRDKVFIATKLPPWSIKSQADMNRILNIQLQNLQTDCIDYYMIHSLRKESWHRMKELGVLSFLEKAKEDGRIRHIGFSYHGDRDTFPSIVDEYDWTFCQIQYNYLDTHNQAGTLGLKYAAKKGLGVIVMEPLRGGVLAKQPPNEVQTIFEESDKQKTPAEWALRWIWNQPEVTTVLSGMTEDSNLEENIRIAESAQPNTLSESEQQTVKQVQKTFNRLMQVGCTNCRYCMPCPSGVDIPGCFNFYNNYHMFDKDPNSKFLYIRMSGVTGEKSTYASLCTECGQCLEQCPQNIDIPKMLKNVERDFETRSFRYYVAFIKMAIAVQRIFLRFRPSKRPS